MSATAGALGAELRVERGRASAEEIAALTAVLLARAATRPDSAAAHCPDSPAGWRRPERTPGFRAPHSWQESG
ncbi:acyl-CoA carboxylase subunit epsilon [Streptomyces sp. DT2A-34]|uniref:acyl-CoA carboxylase subunit epsilon n=1 Tax=Streptomyces sp. DT2A-34 TaxID=3051182 RepID=UPI00265B9970|nr:acyl-CoA carboxylase subunit epsilon [Streptomyces sp. DT2A-34]MDO0912038.1 acyl-CoA carboxylase subunit epsilon [Streptomyces sp. DT2A-34]